MNNGTASFPKREKLCGLNSINALFENGRAMHFPCIKVVWHMQPAESGRAPARLLISIPKRHLRNAVTRNLLKRRIREAYRKNKASLVSRLAGTGQCADVAVIWNNAKTASYAEIEKTIREVVRQLTLLL